MSKKCPKKEAWKAYRGAWRDYIDTRDAHRKAWKPWKKHRKAYKEAECTCGECEVVE